MPPNEKVMGGLSLNPLGLYGGDSILTLSMINNEDWHPDPSLSKMLFQRNNDTSDILCQDVNHNAPPFLHEKPIENRSPVALIVLGWPSPGLTQ